jgi:hypothetical protein
MIRGWIGLIVFCIGIIMVFFEQSRSTAFFPIGFGAGMMSSGFQ